MSQENKYDSTNIQQYFGKEFITHNSTYSLSPKGNFEGRPSIEGEEIKLIAGLEHKHYSKAVKYLLNSSKEKLENLIKKEGKEIKGGLHLVLSLTSEYKSLTRRDGFITSIIKEIK